MSNAERKLSTFRLHLALTTATVAGTFALVIAAAIFVPLVSQLNRDDLDHAALAGIAEYLLQLHATYWPVVAGMLLASVVSGMMLFQRMTAPLVRFVRVFEALAQGKIPRAVRLRRVDYLREEANALNRMLESITERAAADVRARMRLEEALAELEVTALDPKQAQAVNEAKDAARSLRGFADVER